jgi:hypothetical protein
VIVLDDIAPLEAKGDGGDDVRLFPLRSAVEAQRYRDLPWPGGNAFVARNALVGTYISYSVATDAPSPSDSVRIEVKGSDGSVVAHFTGPDRRGVYRVPWDMRYEFKYVPPPSDSGFYGPPKAPYVPPGEYTVTLAARGRTRDQKLRIRADQRGASTADGQREKAAIDRCAQEISRAYYDALAAMKAIDADLAPLDAPSDSSVKAVAAQVAALRQRARGNSIVSGIGKVFDLTAAIESSSMPPTEMQRRSIEQSVAEFTDIVMKLNDVIATQLPALHAKLGKAGPAPIATVRPPRWGM